MTRRLLLQASAATKATHRSITDVPGVTAGHFTDARRPTGCTVLLFGPPGATAGVDVRGAAPGTRETDLLDPVNTVQKIHGLLLTGGSAYGLDAAGGVMRFLEEKKIGYPVPAGVVPIVPAAVIYDLGVGRDPRIRPDAHAGYEAARLASTAPLSEGNVGAGAGASVGKLYGMARAMKGGLGTASARIGDTGIIIGAVVAVNAFGDILDRGKIIAGARTADGKGFADTAARLLAGEGSPRPAAAQNTTIAAIATNAAFDKAQCQKIAQMAHDGLARVIDPVHTPADGDTIFAVATGVSHDKADVGVVGAIAAHVLAEAVLRGIRAARGLPNLPAARDYPR